MSTADAANSPRIVEDPHGYSLPPHTNASNNVDTAATNKAAPAKSMAWSRRTNGNRSTELVITSAATPISKLAGSGVASAVAVDFESSTGALVEAEYLFTPNLGAKARFVAHKYKPSGGGMSIDGNHFGLMLGYYF